MTGQMEEVDLYMEMEISIKENDWMIKPMDMVSIYT